jgi:hypothetical protein
MILRYDLPDGSVIDLNQVLKVGPIFVNKNYVKYNCYEVYLANGVSYGVFDKDLSRVAFIKAWGQ